MDQNTKIPLIWTTKGNLPISSLTYSTAWEHTAEYVKFTETHTDANGEIVKQSVHVFDKTGVLGSGAAAQF